MGKLRLAERPVTASTATRPAAPPGKPQAMDAVITKGRTMTETFFAHWGTDINPIRQSDLTSLFSSMWGCPKRFWLSKVYPHDKPKSVSYKMAMGEVVHQAIENILTGGATPRIPELVMRYEKGDKSSKGQRIDWQDDSPIKMIGRYQRMLRLLVSSREFARIYDRQVLAERAFLVRVGRFTLAGTVDVVVQGRRGEFVCIDWKTGAVSSQFEMDNGYQSNIYTAALQRGVFFNRPVEKDSGQAYYEAFKKTPANKQIRIHAKRAKFIFAHLEEILPAERASTRRARHTATTRGGTWVLEVKKGARRGPVWYSAAPPGTKRLEHSIACAVAFARSGLFPERFGPGCEHCNYRDRCLSVRGPEVRDAVNMMKELGIEPD